MKTIKLLSLTITVLVALSQPTWARGGGGGGRGGGGGHFGGGGFSGGHFGGARAGGFRSGGFGASPRSFGSTRFAGRPFGGSSGALRYYNGGGRMPGARTYTLGSRASRSVTSNSRSRTPITRQPTRVASPQARSNASGSRSSAANRPGSVAGNRVSNSRTSTAANRQSFIQNHARARHDANWHRNWDRHHAHFHNNLVFVFANGFWWGMSPWDYYPYYGYYPYDYYGNDGYPYDDYDYYGSSPYSYYNGYAPSGQYSNGVVSTVQSKLTSLGYYHGAIDGVLGDQTEAALARYQQDQDISVTGTVTSATLQALDLPYSAGY